MRKLSKIISLIVMMSLFMVSTVASAENNDDNYNEVIEANEMNLEVELTDKGVELKWETYSVDNFEYYKIVKSDSNSNPVYPDDHYIKYSANPNFDHYMDHEIMADKDYYYRICVIATPDRYCSNVEKIDVPTDWEKQYDKNPWKGDDRLKKPNQNNDYDKPPRKEYFKEMFEKFTENGVFKFANTDTNDWVNDYASKLGNFGILRDEDKNSKPHDRLNRAEAVRLVVRAYELLNGEIEITTNHEFFDINYDEGNSRAEILSKAVSAEIIAANPMFHPELTITRAQLCKIIATTFYSDNISENDLNDEFPDLSKTHWANKYISVVKKKSLVKGNEDGTFKPEKPISRAEAIKVISNAIESVDPELMEYEEEI